MTTTKNLICNKCKHRRELGTGCEAFDDIPNEILLNNKHDKPLPGQGNDLVFEKGSASDLNL